MLYQKLGRPALGKTMRLVEQSAAEDIVQDVFTKLWQKRMTFPNLRSAYAWVYKCCTNGAIDYLRNHNQAKVTGHEDSQSADGEQRQSGAIESSSNPEWNAQAHEIWAQMVRSLSPEEAELFVYRELEGLSQEEAADVMGISRRTVNRLQEKLFKKIEKFRSQRHAG